MREAAGHRRTSRPKEVAVKASPNPWENPWAPRKLSELAKIGARGYLYPYISQILGGHANSGEGVSSEGQNLEPSPVDKYSKASARYNPGDEILKKGQGRVFYFLLISVALMTKIEVSVEFKLLRKYFVKHCRE